MRFLTVLLVLVGSACTACSETVTWSIENPSFDTLIPVDFGAGLVGITGLQVQVAGDNGGRSFSCGDEGFRATHEIIIEIAGASDRLLFAPDTQFDEVYSVANPDWSDLSDGTTSLYLFWSVSGDWFGCLPVGIFTQLPTISSMVLVLTNDPIVSGESVTWGGIKALYR